MKHDSTVERRGPGLSTDDLGFLFEPHHQELATRLRSTVTALLALEAEGLGEHELSRATIALFGRERLCDLFALLEQERDGPCAWR